MNKNINIIIPTCSALVFSIGALAANGEVGSVVTVGVVPQFSARQVSEIWEPILANISDEIGLKLQLNGSLDIPGFEKHFSAGEFDVAYINPYHAIVANEEAGYIPILRDVGRTLHGILVVKKGNPLKTVEELAGKKVAFPAPNALGSALIPRTEFATKFHIKVEEVYVSNHSSVYLNVILGLVEAGGGVQKTLQQQPEEIQNQLRIIHKTVEVPSHPIVVHPRVNEGVRIKIQDAFLKMDKTVEGKALLGKIPIKTIGSAELKDYDPLREMRLEEFYIQ